jgi:multidrug resistance protein
LKKQPLFWATMSDIYGRKQMYVISLCIFLLASVIAPFSTNNGMFIFFRAIQACGGGSGQTLGAGVIADIYKVSERGNAYGIFYVGPLMAPVLGPSLGGALCEFLGWRSTFYFLCIIGFILLVFIIFSLPETLRLKKPSTDEHIPVTINEPVSIQKKLDRFIKLVRSIFSPMIVMTRDPTVIIITIYNTIVFSCLFFIVSIFMDTTNSLLLILFH